MTGIEAYPLMQYGKVYRCGDIIVRVKDSMLQMMPIGGVWHDAGNTDVVYNILSSEFCVYQEPLNIEVGKFYKTRDGEKVKLYSTEGNWANRIHGAVFSSGYWMQCTWDTQGNDVNCDIEYDNEDDIVAEWTEDDEAELIGQ